MAATEKALLESYLKQLYLKSFIQNYEPLAEEAVQSNQSYTRYLLALGYRVVATDIDVSGVMDLACRKDAEIIEADLETGTWPFGERHFDGIVVTNYLYRPHLPLLAKSLAPGGVLIFDTFARGNELYGHPRNPDFLLAPNELLDAFAPELAVVAYEHGFEPQPRPAMRQRICATRRTD